MKNRQNFNLASLYFSEHPLLGNIKLDFSDHDDMLNYEKHNIKSMDPELLAGICKELGLKEIQSFYYGRFNAWLEKEQKQSRMNRLFVNCIWFCGVVLTAIIPLKNKAFCPYIVLTAKK